MGHILYRPIYCPRNGPRFHLLNFFIVLKVNPAKEKKKKKKPDTRIAKTLILINPKPQLLSNPLLQILFDYDYYVELVYFSCFLFFVSCNISLEESEDSGVSVRDLMESNQKEKKRADGRTENQLRGLACSRNILNRAHGSVSWTQGDTKVLAAVYGPKSGTKKNENPEKACIEVIWKPKTGQIGKLEKEYEMILKRTLQSICVLTINPNTTTSVIIQVVNDDGALLPCAINAACAALVDAGIPLKHLAVAICCCLAECGDVILDPSKLEEQNMKAFVYLVFPNTILSVLPEGSLLVEGEPAEHGIITSVTNGTMSVDNYIRCLERGRAACAKMSDFLRRSLQPQLPSDSSKAG